MLPYHPTIPKHMNDVINLPSVLNCAVCAILLDVKKSDVFLDCGIQTQNNIAYTHIFSEEMRPE